MFSKAMLINKCPKEWEKKAKSLIFATAFLVIFKQCKIVLKKSRLKTVVVATFSRLILTPIRCCWIEIALSPSVSSLSREVEDLVALFFRCLKQFINGLWWICFQILWSSFSSIWIESLDVASDSDIFVVVVVMDNDDAVMVVVLTVVVELLKRIISYHSVWKSQKKSHSTLRAKRATFTFWVDKS